MYSCMNSMGSNGIGSNGVLLHEDVHEEPKGRNSEVHRVMCTTFSFVLMLCVILATMLYFFRGSPHFNTVEPPLQQSKLDNRVYRFGELSNGLKFVIVQDPKASEAGFSVDVSAGTYDSPKTLPGLPHFLEHMLFLGSKRFPEGWEEYIGKHGGMSNAYTDEEETVYYNMLAFDGFEEGLNRFAGFLLDPSLRKEDLREVHAVDSEHAKNKLLPARRMFRVAQIMKDPNGFTGQFYTGNMETLKTVPEKEGISVEQELRTFFNQYYCPNRMHLAIFHRDEPEAIYQNLTRAFEAPARTCFDRFSGTHEHRMGQFAHLYAEISPLRRLQVHWHLPFSLRARYKHQPSEYLEYLFDYENEEHAGLQGLFNSRALLIASGFTVTTTAFDSSVMFGFSLMPDADHEEVLNLLYAYIRQVILRHGVDNKVIHSIVKQSKFQWEWSMEQDSPADLAADWASRLEIVPPSDFTTHSIVEPDAKLISDVLALMTPENSNVLLAEPGDPKNVPQFGTKSNEHYYDIHYVHGDLPKLPAEPRLKGKETVHPPPIRPPPVVKWTVAELKCADGPSGAQFGASPELLASRYYYRFGSVFSYPNYQASFRLISADRIIETPQEQAALLTYITGLSLHMEVINKQIPAASANAHLLVSTKMFGVGISVSGIFSPDSIELATKLCAALRDSSFWTDALFKRAMHSVRTALSDYSTNLPVMNAAVLFRTLRRRHEFTREDLLANLPSTYQEPAALMRTLLSGPLRADAVVIGAIDKEDAKTLRAEILSHFTLSDTPTPPAQREVRKTPLHVVHLNPEASSAMHGVISLYEYAQPTIFDFSTRALVLLVDSIIAPKAFIELRRQSKSPPYVVTAHMLVQDNRMEVLGMVQDHVQDPKDIEAALLQFLHTTVPATLTSLTKEEFETYRSSQMEKLKNPPTSAAGEKAHFIVASEDERICGDGDKFQLQLNMLQALQEVKQTELLSIWNMVVQEQNYSSMKMFAAKPGVTLANIPKGPREKTVAEVKLESPDYHAPHAGVLNCQLTSPVTTAGHHHKHVVKRRSSDQSVISVGASGHTSAA
eukprot:GEMP01006962.1.p1 GENE.GEMP01006962.1~~GEMP01006962.1.p1  ORF type:complete len:1062 (+),score=226.15 GEMP01006962.1:484-3669(+)